jgi:hypothetical protein
MLWGHRLRVQGKNTSLRLKPSGSGNNPAGGRPNHRPGEHGRSNVCNWLGSERQSGLSKEENTNVPSSRVLRAGVAVAPLMLLISCASSSHVLTGTVHPPISSDQVNVYTQAPEYFVEIAQVRASSGASLRSTEEKTDEAIDALRHEAARLGANAIVLEADEDDGHQDTVAYSRTTATRNDEALDGSGGQAATVAIASSEKVLAKTVRGLAIYVSE